MKEKYFVQNILKYYQKHKRNLPWRNIQDPYKIWISEIILQQTQVKQGLDYYLRFVEKFPDVKTLANANEDDVLKVWQGLGYYSRARNLHFAAKQIVSNFNGRFPNKYEDILSLKGVGEYTASAIASFAYNLPYAVLDGNVYRVLSRYFGIDIPIDSSEGKRYFSTLAKKILDKKNPSEYNQAIMEFGATFCKPAQPDCNNCLLNRYCSAYLENKVNLLPIKSKKIIKNNRHLNYLVFLIDNKYTLIHKRNNNDIWKGLYEFYLVESNKTFSKNKIITLLKEKDISFQSISDYPVMKHILTHQNLSIKFYVIQNVSFNGIHQLEKPMNKILLSEIHQYPFPIVIQNFIKENFNY
ncbi:MAG TPA: A/G-specific adenine glycosylase [Bacteroidia bacterium]|nr:A/G-specific adenine glycosylase [Bacteroidia bacterium]